MFRKALYLLMFFKCIQFSRSVVSDSLRSHESQPARPPCPSPTPGVHSNSRPSSRWCHSAISSSVVPFSSWPQSLPASESFPMSQLFAWGGQSTGVSASSSFPPKKSQGWSPSEWTGWISLQSKGRPPYLKVCSGWEKGQSTKQKMNPPTHILPLVNIQRRIWKTANFLLLISLLLLYISLSQPLPGRQKSKNWNLSTLQCFTCFPSVSSTYLSPCVCVCVCVHVRALAKSCLTLCDPVDCSLPGSMEFSRQEYWSEMPFPSPGDLPDSGTEP